MTTKELQNAAWKEADLDKMAKKFDCEPSSLAQLMKGYFFRDEYYERLKGRIRKNVVLLDAEFETAVKTAAAILHDSDATPENKLKAAQIIIDGSAKMYEPLTYPVTRKTV